MYSITVNYKEHTQRIVRGFHTYEQVIEYLSNEDNLWTLDSLENFDNFRVNYEDVITRIDEEIAKYEYLEL